MKRIITIGIAAAAGATLVLGNGTPAKADCLQADVYLTREDTTPTYLNGPNSCVVPTPWPRANRVYGEEQQENTLPPGHVNGAGVNVWIPLPPI